MDGSQSSAAAKADSSDAAVIRQRQPLNIEFPFERLDQFLTPNHRFFVRCHFPVPRLDPTLWRLRIEGAVERPAELSLDDLKKRSARSVAALLECSGNNRVHLVPKAVGLPWGLGAVGVAEWTGASLGEILKQTGLKTNASEVIIVGADSGEPADEPKKPGLTPYARSLPLAKALDPDVLLAWAMNGETLPQVHGFPLRLIVPDWYGMASVKWLTRIIVSEQPFHGYFQTFEYTRFESTHGIPSMVPLAELDPKAQIARPRFHEIVPANAPYRVFGAAWSGGAPVAQVDVSTDGGAHWSPAELLGSPVPHAWRFWQFQWKTPGPGCATLLARATDARGRRQPLERDRHRLNAMISHALPIEVEIA